MLSITTISLQGLWIQEITTGGTQPVRSTTHTMEPLSSIIPETTGVIMLEAMPMGMGLGIQLIPSLEMLDHLITFYCSNAMH